MKFASEGYPFIAGAGLLTLGASAFGLKVLAVPFFAVTLFMFWFFRDPERRAPEGPGLFVAPADGKVIAVQKLREEEFLKDEVLMISIFMSPLDVHVNRAPCDGSVEAVVHHPGKFLKAFQPEASWENERISMVLDTGHGRVLVRQVAGAVARRCVCRVGQGDAVKRGERYGIIKFSSRVDLFLPTSVKPMVSVGHRVVAGETVLAVTS